MPRRDLDQPQTLYDDKVVDGETVEVGVLVAPDDTDPFSYVPYTFIKTISYKRSFGIRGVVTINGEQINQTAEYSYGFDPIEYCQSRVNKLGTGEGVVTIKVVDEPIVLLAEKEPAHSWSRPTREYYPVPNDWFNLSTDEGRAFFAEETVEWNKPWEERMANRSIYDEYYERVRANKFPFRQEEHVLWSSSDTPEQNYQRICELLNRFDQKFKDEDLREILGLKEAA